MSKENNNPKAAEIRLRQAEVERLHIWGYTVAEIAEKVGVDARTVSRDIQENRKGRLNGLLYNVEGSWRDSTKQWVRDELADYIAFMDKAKREFLEQSQTFKTEAAKSRALWHAVEISNQKMETIKSLMFSVNDVATGSMEQIGDDDEDDL